MGQSLLQHSFYNAGTWWAYTAQGSTHRWKANRNNSPPRHSCLRFSPCHSCLRRDVKHFWKMLFLTSFLPSLMVSKSALLKQNTGEGTRGAWLLHFMLTTRHLHSSLPHQPCLNPYPQLEDPFWAQLKHLCTLLEISDQTCPQEPQNYRTCLFSVPRSQRISKRYGFAQKSTQMKKPKEPHVVTVVILLIKMSVLSTASLSGIFFWYFVGRIYRPGTKPDASACLEKLCCGEQG